MATEVIMPQMGFDMREGKILRWLKQPGQEVKRGEAIAEIETDKATVEVEAFAGGVLGRIYVPEGTVVPVGQTIGVITAPGEVAPERPNALAPAAPAPAPQAAAAAPATPPPAERREVRAAITPVARRLAEEAGVPLDEIEAGAKGSGPGGRITREDVEAYLAQRKAAPPAAAPRREGAKAAAPAAVAPPPEVTYPAGIVVPQGLSPMRQAIARRMSLSKMTAPHYYVNVDVEMTRAMQLRQELNADLSEEERISVNDMVIKALALALAKHPHFNVAVLPEGLKPYPNISIGIAVALEEGLIAPGLPDTGSKSLREIAVAAKDLIERARRGRLRPEEYAGGSFSVSNLGMYNVQSFTAIVTPPNAGALAVGAVKPTPVVRGDQVAIAQMMTVTLSADHRATDGAQGAEFINEVRRILERPMALLL